MISLALRSNSYLATVKLLAFFFLTPFSQADYLAPKRDDVLPDDIFLQEVGENIPSTVPFLAVGAWQGEVFAGGTKGLMQLRGSQLTDVPEIRGPVRRIVVALGKLWTLTDNAVWRRDGSHWVQASTNSVSDLTEHEGKLLAADGRRIIQLEAGRWKPVGTNECPFPIHRLISHQRSLYVQGQGRFTVFEFDTFGGRDIYDFRADQGWDWGLLPSPNLRDALSLGPRLWFATERGLGELRGMSMTSVRGPDGLPYEDATCLAKGFANDFWIGTKRGLVRHVAGVFHYFAGKRWLNHDDVHAIAVDGKSVYAATDLGLSVIRFVPFTLESKAAFYEKQMLDWGQKRLGLVHKLEWDAPLGEYVREAGDNDGGYTGDYLAAQSYRFAITKDPNARREAVNTFQALRWLERMTGLPGFPARAVWAKGERGHKATGGSGGFPAEWHDTADGKFEWKGDTSSDELCSHFYAVSLFLELAAQGDEIDQAKKHLARIASHLIRHQWQLIDLDGKPTRWGRWDPDYFRTEEGLFDSGLQSLEILSFMKTAEWATGDSKFSMAYQQLVELDYPRRTLRQRKVFPPDSVANFEDQLAFWSYWNLLRLEKNKDRLSLYRRSFERTFEILRVEQQPWFNFVYGSLTGQECEVSVAVRHLQEWPLDLVTWSYQNSHRTDLHTPRGYVALKPSIRPFSPREREPMRWDAWTMQMDGGSNGNDVVEPSSWLLAYWMGRYYGMIEAPRGRAASLQPLDIKPSRRSGAKPYDGPQRPELPD